jgi:hypothetical protein
MPSARGAWGRTSSDARRGWRPTPGRRAPCEQLCDPGERTRGERTIDLAHSQSEHTPTPAGSVTPSPLKQDSLAGAVIHPSRALSRVPPRPSCLGCSGTLPCWLCAAPPVCNPGCMCGRRRTRSRRQVVGKQRRARAAQSAGLSNRPQPPLLFAHWVAAACGMPRFGPGARPRPWECPLAAAARFLCYAF